MVHGERRHRGGSQAHRLALGQLHDVGAKTPLDARRARETHLHRRLQPGCQAGRPGDDERPGAPAELAVQDEERHAAGMVEVQMAEQHPTDGRRLDAAALHGDQR
jgi:hypothetical protein